MDIYNLAVQAYHGWKTGAVSTVQQVLLSSCFAGARVIAGHSGLTNSISAFVDLAQLQSDRRELNQILVLGQFRDLPIVPLQRRHLIHDLYQHNAAGLILGTKGDGANLQSSLALMIEEADGRDLPLVLVPDVPSAHEAARQLDEIGVHEKGHILVEEVFSIHRQLSTLVLEGANLSALADLLASLLQRAVTIETPELQLLAHAEYGQIDPARADSIREAQTPLRLRQILKNQGLLDLMESTQKPVVLEPEPSGGMTMQRVVAPIIVGTERYGYVWIIAGNRPLHEVDLLAIESASIVAALIILRDRVAQAGEERLRSDLLIRLIHEDLQSVQELLTHFRRLRFDLGRASQLLVCTSLNSGMEEIHFLRQDASIIVSQLGIQGLVTDEAGYIIVLFLPQESESESSETEEGIRLAQALLQKDASLRIGLSEICRTVGDVQHAYQQMCDALMVAEHLHLPQPIITTRDVGYLNILSKVPREAVASNLYYQRILSLEAYDEQSRAELVKTLEAFLEAGGNITRTAETLFVHRGTIHYRLGIVEGLIQMDLSDPLIQLNLIVALKLYRLRNLIL